MRHTSLAAFTKLKESKGLSRQRWLAYETMFKHGPMTAAELCRKAGKPGLWKRCSELKRAGLFKETGTRRCRITGSTVIEMDVTDFVPEDGDKLDFSACAGELLFVVKSEGKVGRAFGTESSARTFWENEDKVHEFLAVKVVRKLS